MVSEPLPLMEREVVVAEQLTGSALVSSMQLQSGAVLYEPANV
jgi:hypothetical protein